MTEELTTAKIVDKRSKLEGCGWITEWVGLIGLEIYMVGSHGVFILKSIYKYAIHYCLHGCQNFI